MFYFLKHEISRNTYFFQIAYIAPRLIPWLYVISAAALISLANPLNAHTLFQAASTLSDDAVIYSINDLMSSSLVQIVHVQTQAQPESIQSLMKHAARHAA